MAATAGVGPTTDAPLVEGDWAPACGQCSYQWQALRQALALRAAHEHIDLLVDRLEERDVRIELLLDDLARAREVRGHGRAYLAVVAPPVKGA